MVEDAALDGEDPWFSLEIKSEIRIISLDEDAFIRGFAQLPRRNVREKQLERRIGQAGGSLPLDPRLLPPRLSDAAYAYIGSATYAFETNPGYRYSQIRFVARRALAERGLLPFSTVLRHEGFTITSHFSLGEVELGSIKFWQTVQVGVGIAAGMSGFAATAPTAYKNFNEIYLPQATKVTSLVLEYVDDYFSVLAEIGVNFDQKTLPIHLAPPPTPPTVIPRRKRGEG